MTDVMIHIGLHKTASTFLQKRVFPNSFAGTDIDYNPRGLMEALIPIFEFECYSDAWLNMARRRFEDWKANSNGKRLFLSAESFSQLLYIQNYQEHAQRLNQIFGNIRICVLIRNQYDWLTSVYKETLKSGDYQSFEDFVNWDAKRANFSIPGRRFKSKRLLTIDVEKADWNALLHSLFKSSQDVKVLLYEDLRRDIQGQLKNLSEWCGVTLSVDKLRHRRPVNPGISDNSIRWLLMYARLKKLLGFKGGYFNRFQDKQLEYADMDDYFSKRRSALPLSKLVSREILRLIDRCTIYRLFQLCDPILQKLMCELTDQMPVLRNEVMAVHHRSNEELFKVLNRKLPESYQYHESGE